MSRKKLIFIITIALCGFVIAIAFALNPFRGLRLVASVVSATPTADETSPTIIDEEVTFSDEEVAAITSPKENVFTDTDKASSTIAIVATDTEVSPLPSLETEVIIKNDKATHIVSYKYDVNTLTAGIHTASNQFRIQEGVLALTFDSKLAQIAIDRSIDMATNHTLSHTASDGCDLQCQFEKSGYATMIWGENLGEFQPYTTLTPEKLAERFVKEWAGSSGHRKNLLSENFTHEGVGVALNGNRVVVTVIFTRQE